MKLVEITDRQQWDGFVLEHPWGHPLQLWAWGETKRANAWTPHRLALVEGDRIVAGIQVLLWRLPRLSYYIVYGARGPVAEPGSAVSKRLLAEVADWAKDHQGLYVRIDPAWRKGVPAGWRRAKHQLQMAETYVIDLRKSEAELQEPMSRKHRQYIRKAERDGVMSVRVTSGSLEAMFEIYQATAARAGFGIHPKSYYEQLHANLGEQSYLYYAEAEGKPVAFLWLAVAGATAYELYGGVSDDGQERKANYSLKWHAILNMKQLGLQHYDFNGRVTEGVARFKEGFGAEEVDYIGTYDFPLNTLGYRLWEGLWPVVKQVGRRLKGHR